MLSAIALFSISNFSIAASLGGETGNAGQRVALEFSQSASKALGVLHQLVNVTAYCDPKTYAFQVYGKLCELDQAALASAVANTHLVAVQNIRTTDPVSGKQIELSAENFPSLHQINISIDYWTHEPCGFQKMSLALHEYLGILGIEQDSYQYSSLFRNLLDQHGNPPDGAGCFQDGAQ
jgi:hypothetical protein